MLVRLLMHSASEISLSRKLLACCETFLGFSICLDKVEVVLKCVYLGITRLCHSDSCCQMSRNIVTLSRESIMRASNWLISLPNCCHLSFL